MLFFTLHLQCSLLLLRLTNLRTNTADSFKRLGYCTTSFQLSWLLSLVALFYVTRPHRLCSHICEHNYLRHSVGYLHCIFYQLRYCASNLFTDSYAISTRRLQNPLVSPAGKLCGRTTGLFVLVQSALERSWQASTCPITYHRMANLSITGENSFTDHGEWRHSFCSTWNLRRSSFVADQQLVQNTQVVDLPGCLLPHAYII